MEKRRDKPNAKAKRTGWARRYKLFWDTHKWAGILAFLFLLNVSVTGILLLVKKQFEWIQPPTQSGVEGKVEDFIPTSKLVEIVLSQDHPAFQSFADIDRVDFRPGRRVHKVRSVHDHAEIQVDAVTGEVLSVDWRPSDLIESLHDGSFFGGWVHDYLMPMAAVLLMFLVGSGLYLWLSPWWKKRRT